MANEILYKEELQPTLNTIIGETPKTLPAVLNKGDIVKYGNYLYKYKGVNGVRKELVDEGSFKKVGLRYRGNGYKVDIVDSMENLYKWMYEVGLNGDRQKSGWVSNRRSTNNINFKFKGNGRLSHEYESKTWNSPYPGINFPNFNSQPNISRPQANFLVFEGTNSNESFAIEMRKLVAELKKYAKTENLNDIIEFPIKLSHETYTLEEFEKNRWFKVEDLKKIKLKKAPFIRALNEEYRKIKEYINNPNIPINTSDFMFFSVENLGVIPSYQSSYVLSDRTNTKKFTKTFINRFNFNFGVFENWNYKKYEFEINESILGLDGYKSSSTRESGGMTEKYYRSKAWLTFTNGKFIEEGSSLSRFWLPYFNDMEGSDYSGESARTLNRDFNKYGIYFKLEDDGNYVYRFKSVFTDRNQHEEWGTKGPWGARYAYYLSVTDVRGDGDTYCRWQSKKVDTEVTFTIEGSKLININIKFGEETRDTNRLKNEFINTGYSYEDGYLFIKVFYAIWSYDDNGDWNEWQFAHVIPPFSLEFKGDNEFESKPINNANNHFKPPVDEWED